MFNQRNDNNGTIWDKRLPKPVVPDHIAGTIGRGEVRYCNNETGRGRVLYNMLDRAFIIHIGRY